MTDQNVKGVILTFSQILHPWFGFMCYFSRMLCGRIGITPLNYEIESSGFFQHLQRWFYYKFHYFFSFGQVWVCLCVRHISIFLWKFNVWCFVTDVQTRTQSPNWLINNGLQIRIIPEDVAKNRNFLSKKMRALLQFSHKSSEKKTQKNESWV